MSNSFLSGLTFWLRGWKKLLTTKNLFAIAIIPICVSLIFFAVALYVVFAKVGGVVASIMAWLPSWITSSLGHWLDIPMMIIFGLLFATFVTYVMYLLHMLIAIPFYALLADRTLRARGIPMPAGLSLRVFRASLLKSVLFLVFGVLLFVLQFVPGLNLVVIASALLILAADILTVAHSE